MMITTTANASSRPWMSSVNEVIARRLGPPSPGPTRPETAAEIGDEPVELHPARRLDEDDVAGPQPIAKQIERRLAVAGLDDPGHVQPGIAGRHRDPLRARAP